MTPNVIWDPLLITWKKNKTLRSRITYIDYVVTYVDWSDLIRTINAKVKLFIGYKSVKLTITLPNGIQQAYIFEPNEESYGLANVTAFLLLEHLLRRSLQGIPYLVVLMALYGIMFIWKKDHNWRQVSATAIKFGQLKSKLWENGVWNHAQVPAKAIYYCLRM